MTPSTIALLVSLHVLSSALAAMVATRVQRENQAAAAPLLPAGTAAPVGVSFHDVALLVATLGILIHGDTENRSPGYIRNKAAAVAGELVKARRAA